MPWQVYFVREAEADLEALGKGGLDAEKAEDLIRDEFEDEFKAARIEKALEGAARSDAVVRLEKTRYPPSVRITIHRDYRATVWCHPMLRLAVVTHVFHKSQDPDYVKAVRMHDGRLKEYVEDLVEYFNKKRRD